MADENPTALTFQQARRSRDMEGYGLIVGAVVVVLVVQIFLFPMLKQGGERNRLLEQAVISLSAGALAVALYNPITQVLQDKESLESGATSAYIKHGLAFAVASFGVMVLGDLLGDLFKEL